MSAKIELRALAGTPEGQVPQWWVADDPGAVAIAQGIGLPTLRTPEGWVRVFLPGPLMNYYRAKAEAANVELVTDLVE